MSKHYSLYLDVVRFLASLFVLLDHYNQHHIVSKSFGFFIPELGREAVIIFFVLSGFVIAYTTQSKQQSLKEYVIARCARIYSVALPVLLLAFLLSYLGSVYFGKPVVPTYQVLKAYIYIPFHSLFMGELWKFSEVPPLLTTYWSLGYEVWYYVFFAALYFFSGYKRIILGLMIFLILGYKLWLLLPIWLTGTLLFYKLHRFSLSFKIARIGWFFSIVFLCLYKYFNMNIYLQELGILIWPFKSFALGSASRYLADYCVCIIVLLNFYFAKYAEFIELEKFSVEIRIVSSYTFTLYLAHMLVISMWLLIYPHNSSSVGDIFMLSMSIGVVTYLLGSITEHKKYWYSNLFTRIFDYIDRVQSPFFSQFKKIFGA